MPVSSRALLIVPMALAGLTLPLAAQDLPFGPLPKDAPEVALPRRDWSHRQALVLYGEALVCEKANEPVEACHLLEQAAQLEPRSAMVHRALAPLYQLLGRQADALEEAKQAFALDPSDYDTGHLYAQQLRDRGQLKEASDVLAQVVAAPRLAKHVAAQALLEFEFARLARDTKQSDRAEQAFRKAARAFVRLRAEPEKLADVDAPIDGDGINSRLVEAYEGWIQACMQNRHYEQAVAAFTEAQGKGLASDARLRYQLVQCYVARKDPAEALKQLDLYLRSQPTDVEPYRLRARLLETLGREDEILPSLEAYARRDAHNIELQLLLAHQYAVAGRQADAEAHCRRLLDESPTPNVYHTLFEVYKDHGRMAQALSMLDSDMARAAGKKDQPGDAAAVTRARAMLATLRDHADLGGPLVDAAIETMTSGRKGLDFETERLVAALAERAHKLDAAERILQNCLDNFQGHEHESDVYFGLLGVLSQEHKPADIIRVCRRGLKEAALVDRRLFHDYLARALAMTGKDDEAIAEAGQAVDLAGADGRVAARLFRADIFRMVNRCNQGIAECQALLKEATSPKDVHDIRYTLSGLFSAAHQTDQAEAQLRRILEKDADDATANNDLGYMLADQGKSLPEAEAMIRKAIEVDRRQRAAARSGHVGLDDDRDHAAYLDSLGWVLFRRGHARQGLEQLKKAAALPDGNDPVIWDHLGDVYFRLDRPQDARTAWQKAVTLYESPGGGRRPDDQYKNIRHKLKMLGKSSTFKTVPDHASGTLPR